MALVSWSMDYASAKSLQGRAVMEIIAISNLCTAPLCNVLFFLFLFLSVSTVILCCSL